MENVNYIYGKTVEGKHFTLDGFRVESFMIYEKKNGDTCIDIFLKSGEELSIFAFTDEGESIPDHLADCMLALKKNPKILTKPHPVSLIGCDTEDWIEYFFDGNAVEYYVIGDHGLVELHFASGIVINVQNGLDEKLYPGENVVTMVDDCICRYFKDKN